MWVGAVFLVVGIAATLLLVYRWATRVADWRWRTALRAAVAISLPMGLGLALCFVVVFVTLGGVDPVAWALLLVGPLVLSYLTTVLGYMPYIHWAAHRSAGKSSPG